MKPIAIYTLTSELHDAQAVAATSNEFLDSLQINYELRGTDYADYGTHTLDLIYVRTGGTEGIFLRLLPQLLAQSQRPFYLLTSGKSNSLAASMEILSYLHQQGYKGEIIHGNGEYIHNRICILSKSAKARQRLQGIRLGVIGQPSDWLIASHADKDALHRRLGIELVDIPIEELLTSPHLPDLRCALRSIVQQHRLQGFTLRCFDLLTALHDTGCMALAQLNAEGIVAGCEGDVPALISMSIVNALLDISGFQANPSNIDIEQGTITFAHCTIPLNMVERYELDTHFESGIGVAVRGFMKTGPVTVFKVSGDLQRCFIAEGELLCNESRPDLCRTQQVIRLANPADANYFLTRPIGNHHIIMPGCQKTLLEEITQLKD
jgi:L-fucose isomerase-like protein